VTVGGSVINLGVTVTAGGATNTGITPANWGAVGIALNPVSVSKDSFQSLSDSVVGTPGSSPSDLSNVLSSMSAAAQSAAAAANSAASDLVALITKIVGGAGSDVEALIASLNGTGSTSVVNTNQIAALWAHVSASSTAGIHYSFSPSVALTANYAGTTNPAWAAAGSYTMPSVFSGTNWVYSTSGWQGMVFTGNPNNVVTGDHGLVTDKNQVFATYRVNAFGTAILFMSGHYTGGNLLQHMQLELGYGGPSALRVYAATAPGTRGSALTMTFPNTTTGTQYDIPGGVKDGDVWGMQYDGAGHYSIYFNNVAVATVPDPGVTHGAGYREVGILTDNVGSSFFGVAEFTALDYV
jgi:hypothetical protein